MWLAYYCITTIQYGLSTTAHFIVECTNYNLPGSSCGKTHRLSAIAMVLGVNNFFHKRKIPSLVSHKKQAKGVLFAMIFLASEIIALLRREKHTKRWMGTTHLARALFAFNTQGV